MKSRALLCKQNKASPLYLKLLKLKSVSFSLIRLLGNVVKRVDTSYVDKCYATKPLVLLY